MFWRLLVESWLVFHLWQPFLTPSPFSFSGTSTRWSSRPPIHHSNLFLRFFVLLFSFISALTLAAPSTKKKYQRSPSFTEYPELVFPMFKGICDIAQRGILISDMTSDYLSFVLDQARAIPVIRRVGKITPFSKETIVSTSTSFATFLVIAICALLSGYKLCKRIIW